MKHATHTMRAASLANLTADPSKLRRQPPVTKCSECGAEPPRDELFVKRVRWESLPPLGQKNGGSARSRTVAHQCRACMEADPDFARAPHVASPAFDDLTGGTPKP